MASVLHLKGIEQAFLGNIDMESDTIKMAFMAVALLRTLGQIHSTQTFQQVLQQVQQIRH